MKQAAKQIGLPFLNAFKYKEKKAIIDVFGKHTFNDLVKQSQLLSKHMLHVVCDKETINPHNFKGENIAILCDNDHTYVNAQWATWMLGATYVPLSNLHPLKELEHIINDCKPKLLVGTSNHSEILTKLKQNMDIDLLTFEPVLKDNNQIIYSGDKKTLPSSLISDNGLQSLWNEIDWSTTSSHILYTSGTTGRPKGVVSSFSNLISQVKDINEAWDVSCSDGYLHVLPLHHVHGIVNNLISPLMAGALVTMLPKFNAEQVRFRFNP